jgi:beta-galactosidase GanA
MEPEEERFEFGWLERAIAVLQREGISVLLGTPIAGPPAWLVNATDPAWDCRQVYESGLRWQFGGRSLCCVNHPRFIERSGRIAGALGAHFADNPAVMGFQVDNEVGMYGTRCHCAVCRRKFREWMQRKYGAISAVNERLGTIFGGGLFRHFEDIPIPRLGQDLHNPGLLLDSQRFFSESNADFLRRQVEALRAAGVRRVEWSNLSGVAAPPKERLGEDAAAWSQLQRPGTVPVVAASGPLAGQYAADTWCDHLEVVHPDVEVLAKFAEGSPAGGAPAATCRRFGAGRAVYVAACLEPRFNEKLLEWLLGRPAAAPHAESALVEIVPAASAKRRLYFILNHGPTPARVVLPPGARDLLTGISPAGEMSLAAYDVVLIAGDG